MGLDLRQQQKLAQQLVMTQQLQQAIKLLQLNHLELVEHVEAELLENPTLEEIPGTNSDSLSDAEVRMQSDVAAVARDTLDQNNGAEEGSFDWSKVLDEYGSAGAFKTGSGAGDYDDLPPIESTLRTTTSLADHLLWQLGMREDLDDAELNAAGTIVHNLDENGWLDASPDQIAEEADVSLDVVEAMLTLVQTLDPVGCGARGLKDCLCIQARVLWPEDPTVEAIIRNHLPDLETRNYAGIARALELQLEDVLEYHKMMHQLEPWPGRQYSDDEPQYITPDITVVKIGGEWRILQNEDGLPRLRVSPYYRKVLQARDGSKEEREYIKGRLESADFLIKSIYKRRQTIHKVMQSILDRQSEFFDKGPEHLRPMILRDVAEEIGVHESTVSRVTTNKYVQCPHGILELKYFFNASIQRTNGEDLAAEAVKQMIRKLIADEDGVKPLSDQSIAKMLARQNIQIARRTVAKYREAMGILPSQQRKQLF